MIGIGRKSIALGMLAAMGAFANMQPSIASLNQSAYAQPSRRQMNKYRSQGSVWSYPAHDGHSVAHGKRIAAKARNVKRHKRASKGK